MNIKGNTLNKQLSVRHCKLWQPYLTTRRLSTGKPACSLGQQLQHLHLHLTPRICQSESFSSVALRVPPSPTPPILGAKRATGDPLVSKRPVFRGLFSSLCGSHGLNARRARRTKSRGPKDLQLEVADRKASGLLVIYIT